jgi:hypothetical protein
MLVVKCLYDFSYEQTERFVSDPITCWWAATPKATDPAASHPRARKDRREAIRGPRCG